MIFRQLFDPETSTYSYLLGDESTRQAVLIDSVAEQFDRDVLLLRELELELAYALETHVHADHVTASGRLREALGCKVGVGALSGVTNADVLLEDGGVVRYGERELRVVSTPGHTNGCVTYVDDAAGAAFTGDVLLIRGCGRTDFQQGDAAELFSSVRTRLFTLPDDTRIHPGHDYRGRMMSTVAEEKRFNLRISPDRNVDEFVEVMRGLDLAYPKKMDVAVPANLQSGLVSDTQTAERGAEAVSVADVMERHGRQDAEAWVGYSI